MQRKRTDIEQSARRCIAQSGGVNRLKQIHGHSCVAGKNLRNKIADGVAFFGGDRTQAVVGG